MLTGLSKTKRLKAALVLSLLYALCILMPNAALAFGSATAHCLTEPPGAAHMHRTAAQTHVHADGVMHTHSDKASHHHGDAGTPEKHSDGDGKTHNGTCCGLFCISAIAHEPPSAFPATLLVTRVSPPLDDALSGRGPARINRPPIG
jgi:hypothetical protein